MKTLMSISENAWNLQEHSTSRLQLLPLDTLERCQSTDSEKVTLLSCRSERLPETFCEHGSCVFNDILYIAGGQNQYCRDGRYTTDRVYCFDPILGIWSSVSWLVLVKNCTVLYSYPLQFCRRYYIVTFERQLDWGWWLLTFTTITYFLQNWDSYNYLSRNSWMFKKLPSLYVCKVLTFNPLWKMFVSALRCRCREVCFTLESWTVTCTRWQAALRQIWTPQQLKDILHLRTSGRWWMRCQMRFTN